ncbi:hypothetical protein PhaeoP75_02958 [Phaeobacter gallaeciensis]|uniref:Uncharacterized protein n=2 Tax=Phaeobacter TaxID=302485 RepID=A0AAC9ZBH3_9RHOB|nr:hypothetical protein Gal_02919 [Phaeobacter gallaeciensis DSM 26640]ATE93914.1 hypothetical protein PhaeoP11_02909 [Phaeobacter gallaeciensis]ATG42466.1 hypothetical protein PhaeoP13_00503 [Phaeobacter piscinae]ATE96265.1 hypothetical protein PhaeoP73_00938 [Phaeobacter gallaeciensis]ATF02578.1 hypothetical protein PhaeoP75_02958 [Phaeobacter gallaeciensis]
MMTRKEQRLSLGGCEAPSRGEGRALPGLQPDKAYARKRDHD